MHRISLNAFDVGVRHQMDVPKEETALDLEMRAAGCQHTTKLLTITINDRHSINKLLANSHRLPPLGTHTDAL